MTESQKRLLELLPRMAEKFPKRFMFDGWGSYAYFFQVEGDKLLPACLTYVDRQTGELRFSYITPALIVEAVRLEAHEHGWSMVIADYPVTDHALPSVWFAKLHTYHHHEYGDEYDVIESEHTDFDAQDPFDRARAACEALLEVAA